MKICSKCHINKADNEFYRVKKDGAELASRCKVCASEDQKIYRQKNINSYRNREGSNKKRRRKNIQKQIRNYLQDKSCQDCGYAENIAALQFDHINPTEKFKSVADLVAGTYSWTKIWEEISKCEIVCANCHSIRTAKQFNWYGE